MPKRFLMCLLVIAVSLGLLSDLVTASGTLIASGEQTRGSAGHDSQLSGKAFTLASEATITSINCNGDGFWIEGYGLMFQPASSAIGVIIPAGTYNVYPLLKNNQSSANVSVIFSW